MNLITTRRSILLLFFLLCIAYSNSFFVSWQFDDHPNILNNKNIQINTLSFSSLKEACFSPKNKNKISRPVAMISFALNWYFHKDNVFGYHVINFLIHFFNSCLLFKCLLLIFNTPKLKNIKIDLYFVSFLSAALWALNPIQTQAVTYIVQRMAILAAFFYLCGIFFFLKAKDSGEKKYYYFIIPCYLFGVLSKENAAILPLSLLLIEIFFFNNLNKIKKFYLWVIIFIIIFVGICFFFGNGDFLFLVKGYSWREFTLKERIYTQFRILIFYISQIFYPLPSRLSLSHYFPLSQSFFMPLTTFFSFTSIFFLIVISWVYKKKYPIFCFAILFFFLNHIIESSVIPLELIFEHRNYIPSFFLFTPLGIFFYKLLFDYHSKLIKLLSVFCLVVLFIFFGTSTFKRNNVWLTKESLWQDAFLKNPHDSRTLNNYAINLAWNGKKKQDKYIAIELFKKSLEYRMPRKLVRAEVYGNIANVYSNLGENKLALFYYEKALNLDQNNTKIRYEFTKNQFLLGDLDNALLNANILIKSGVKNPDYYNIYGFILLWKNKPKDGLNSFQEALRLDPYNYKNILINTGYALSELGYYNKAEWFYKFSVQYKPQMSIFDFLLLIENSIKSNNYKKTDYFLDLLFDNFPLYKIFAELKNLDKKRTHPPLCKATIDFFIKEKMDKILKKAANEKVF
jgi:tetratricopeptide (TPR) repeat protein